jgi:hypothetical protein
VRHGDTLTVKLRSPHQQPLELECVWEATDVFPIGATLHETCPIARANWSARSFEIRALACDGNEPAGNRISLVFAPGYPVESVGQGCCERDSCVVMMHWRVIR